jgi:hypothetical protein
LFVVGLESILQDDIASLMSSTSSSASLSSSSSPPASSSQVSLPRGVKAIRSLYYHRYEWYQLHQFRSDPSITRALARRGGTRKVTATFGKQLNSPLDYDLCDSRIDIVICGASGIGKSALAIRFASGTKTGSYRRVS